GCLTLFFTVVKIILIHQCHTGAEAGFKSKRSTWSRFRQPSEAISKSDDQSILAAIVPNIENHPKNAKDW
ncbi:unnamed protein product, partial [Tenebrio molitor]